MFGIVTVVFGLAIRDSLGKSPPGPREAPAWLTTIRMLLEASGTSREVAGQVTVNRRVPRSLEEPPPTSALSDKSLEWARGIFRVVS